MKKIFTFLLVGIIFSCSSPTPIEDIENYAKLEGAFIQEEEHFVNLEEAMSISKNFYRSDENKAKSSLKKKLQDT